MLAAGIPDLWSPGDDADLRRCDACLAVDDLAGALLSIEGADADTRTQAQRRVEGFAAAVRDRAELPLTALVRVLGPVIRVVPRGQPPQLHTCALSAVLAGRPGQPAVVAAAWLLVARQAGLDAYAVAMPGQILIAVGRPGLILDPSTAQVLPADGLGWPDPDRLPPCSPEALADQVLRDLLFCAERIDDDVCRFRSLNFLAHMHPDEPGPQVALGLVAEAIGAVALAAEIYRRVRAEFEDAHEARIADRRQRWLASHPRWLQ